MKNKRNVRYAIINSKGFILDKATGSTAYYHSAQEAVKYMKPGDQIVPIENKDELLNWK